MEKYKLKDLYNGEKMYSDTHEGIKRLADKYMKECGGDWIPEYRVLNLNSGKYRLMKVEEIRALELPY